MRDIDRALPILRAHAWNVTAYQIVNPGIAHWFSRAGDAVIGYIETGGVRVAAGAPVCAPERVADILDEFADDSARARRRVCYFGAAGRVHDVLSRRDRHSVVVLGAQPVWNPANWPTPETMRASLRAQLARARNKGVVVNEWTVERSAASPELRVVLSEWLARKPLPSMRFLVEPQTLDSLTDKRIFVAERDEQPVGFVTLAPIPTRAGWLTEQFVRGEHAPNGTVELMLDTAARTVARSGTRYFTMGLVPLSSRNWDPNAYNPLWLRFTLAWVRAHGRRFYSFDGLEAFKAKFDPDTWEPIYAIANEPRFSPRTLWAIADAFSDRSPISMLARGATKAVQTELRRARPERTRR